jgi:hypothetical protein
MHHNAPWWASFRRVCRIDYTKNNNQTNNNSPYYTYMVSLMCLIVVLVGLPLLTIYRVPARCICWTMRIINLILYAVTSDEEVPLNPLTSCTRINFDVRSYGCVWNDRPWAGSWSPCGNIARPLSGKWPERTRSCSGWFIQSFCRRIIVPEASGHPTVTFPYNSLVNPKFQHR